MRRAAQLLIILAICAIVAIGGAALVSRYVRAHAIELVKKRYGDAVEVSDLNVSLFPRIVVRSGRVIMRQKERPGFPPLIVIERAFAETNWAAALQRRIATLRLEGLKITVPPRRETAQHQTKPKNAPPLHIDRIVADGTVLRILPKKPGKEPLEFDIHRLTLRDEGPDNPMSFDAVLKNAKPPGEIQSSGKFGPWNPDPALTPVSGTYTFHDANLGVFRGISGKLSSEGRYNGQLDNIHVEGHTDTPDFMLRVSGHPVHLTTEFQARVDGTNGNTYLDSVNGKLGNTNIQTRGVIERLPGAPGRTVSLDAKVAGGRLEDLLRLSVRASDAPMTGAVTFHTKIVIPPGDVDIVQKLQLDGAFAIDRAEFSKLSVQEKVNELSNRGRGDPQAPPTDTVASNFRGRFKLAEGTMTFSKLHFDVPGIAISLDGTYGLLDERLDLRGEARLQAKLSQTTTGFKSLLLKVVDGFFAKKGAGAVVPLKIGGTANSPSFGLSL